MFLYPLLSAATAFDAFEPIAKWLTVGLLALLLVTGVVVFFAKRTVFGAFVKYAVFGAFVYLLTVAIAFFTLDVAQHYSDEYAAENWLDKRALLRFVLIPLLALSAIALCSLVAFALTAKFRPQSKKRMGIVCGAVCFVALIVTLVCLALYYHKKIANDGYYNSDTAKVEQLALYIGAALCIAAVIGLSALDKQKLLFDSRSLAYAGICAAMSFALSYVKLWDMPQGGSITLVSLLPLMIYAYIFGAKKGVFVGFVYGVLQAVQDPWLIHPAQFLLDYPVAFASAGLAGLFRTLPLRKKLPQVTFALGAAIAGTTRFLCHVLSGALAFEAYAGGQNVWVYSLVYNSYVFVDVALVIVVGIFVFSSKAFLQTVGKLNKSKASDKETTA